MEEKRILKKDSLVMMTYGEYSDYQVHSVCRVLEDFDIDNLAEEFKALHPDYWDRYGFNKHGDFIDWVIEEKKLVELLDYFEWQVEYQFSTNDRLFEESLR